ncbi:MAG: hypothetical protein ABFD62_00755 [Syntrophaceae bacterium]
MLASAQPMEVLYAFSPTPADNREGFRTAIPWISRMTGEQVRTVFRYSDLLRSMVLSPFVQGLPKVLAFGQNYLLENYFINPTRQYARDASLRGYHPDPFGEFHDMVCGQYADLLQSMCGNFIRDGAFDIEAARNFRQSPHLGRYLQNFARLEYASPVLGMTRLKAMKDLLKNLLIVLAEQPPESGELPFRSGKKDEPFEAYLELGRSRFVNLFQERAFDIRAYAERATGGVIGFTPFRIVDGSEIHTCRLRHYLLPEGVQPNGRVLYVNTPLINKPEIFDLADGKSIIQKMLQKGYAVYVVDHGEPGPAESRLGLDFYGKELHDRYLDLVKARHPGWAIEVMAYCMAGTLILPYLARRAEERLGRGEQMDIQRVVLMASPVKFDDGKSGHRAMRRVIRRQYDGRFMQELFGDTNIPPQIIESGMHEIQPGVQYNINAGFYLRATHLSDIRDSAPFLYWITHGTKFPTRAHYEWVTWFFLENRVFEGKYTMPSKNPGLDGKPVNMGALKEAGVVLFDYRGSRDPIAPVGSCVASETWGQARNGNIGVTRGGLNRTIERNAGHIFVVSRKLLGEYVDIVSIFLEGT